MWQEVSADDATIVQEAFEVLTVRDPTFGSIERFKAWLQGRTVHYFKGSEYELVVGFRFLQPQGEWHVATAGLRGDLSREAIADAIGHSVEFMKQQKTRTLFGTVPKRAASDPLQQMLQSLASEARKHEDVQEIVLQDHGAVMRFGVVLR